MRVAVVGGGVIGLAAAWNAARRGAKVELFEAGPRIPHAGSASVDQHRLCRVPYGDQDGYAALMAPAMEAWERVWQALDARHYAETGCLALCTAERDWTDRSRASLARLGLPHRVLPPAEVAARCPMLAVEDARYGLWTEPGGVLFADAITQGFADLAAEAGVALHPGAPVASVGEDGMLGVGTGRALPFDAVLVAAGAWTPALLPWTAPGVTVLRQVVAYAEAPAHLGAAWARAPILLDMGGPRGMFCAPPVAGRGLKFGCGARNHPSPPGGAPDARPEEAAALMDAWRARLVDGAAYRVTETRVCWYANEATQTFVTGRRGRVLAFTGCSGHAFKLAALLGEGLAAALVGGGDGDLAWIRGDAAALDLRRLSP